MFQSYLVYGSNPQDLRKKTIELVREAGIDLKANSPDIFTITPIKKSIIIDQIRNLKSHIAQKPLKSKYKLVIIENAHLATIEAQNALLKTLEEPPTHAIIILEAKNYKSLLPTILSRVVKVRAHPVKPKAGAQPLRPGVRVIEDEDRKEVDQRETSLLGVESLNALLQISQVDNPQEFLDDQIILLTKLLTATIRANQPSQKLASAIEKCLETKKMIDANVNPKFALANLIFSLNLAPK